MGKSRGRVRVLRGQRRRLRKEITLGPTPGVDYFDCAQAVAAFESGAPFEILNALSAWNGVEVTRERLVREKFDQVTIRLCGLSLKATVTL